jgi:hypothetical protein
MSFTEIVNRLPVVSWRELSKFFGDQDYEFRSQKGSHIKMISRTAVRPPTVFPRHEELDRKTLRNALEMAGFSEQDFLNWYT